MQTAFANIYQNMAIFFDSKQKDIVMNETVMQETLEKS